MKIILVPIGKVDDNLIPSLTSILNMIFGVEVDSGEKITVPPYSYDKNRNQYKASTMLSALKKTKIPSDAKILGITDVDLFAPGLNFVFGQAEFKSQAAIISLFRLHDENYFYDRAAKEAVHELGHTFGLDHCPDIHCIMHFSNSLHDTDIKNVNFCSKCHPMLIR